MQKKLPPVVFFLFSVFFASVTHAQVADTTKPSAVNADLQAITDTKFPKEYILSAIKVTGTKYLDAALLSTISGLAVGDKVTIPGGDNFSKAIENLWKQNLFSDVQIYFTKLEGTNLSIEIQVQERPRASRVVYRGAKKGELEDLAMNTNLHI